MAQKQKQPAKTCADCIHESACRMWAAGRFLSDASASVCPNHETVKESGAYLCGVLDERNKKKTNADRIRSMSDEELEKFINHFDVCDFRTNEECKMSYCGCCEICVMDWLQQPAEDQKDG